EVRAIHRQPRGPGAACDLLLLLGHARQPEGWRQPDGRTEDGAALGRTGELPEEGAALPDPELGTGRQDAGCLDGNGAEVNGGFRFSRRGEGGPQGRMRGATGDALHLAVRRASPHLPFGHLLPEGEKRG